MSCTTTATVAKGIPGGTTVCPPTHQLSPRLRPLHILDVQLTMAHTKAILAKCTGSLSKWPMPSLSNRPSQSTIILTSFLYRPLALDLGVQSIQWTMTESCPTFGYHRSYRINCNMLLLIIQYMYCNPFILNTQ